MEANKLFSFILSSNSNRFCNLLQTDRHNTHPKYSIASLLSCWDIPLGNIWAHLHTKYLHVRLWECMLYNIVSSKERKFIGKYKLFWIAKYNTNWQSNLKPLLFKQGYISCLCKVLCTFCLPIIIIWIKFNIFWFNIHLEYNEIWSIYW